MVLDASGKWLPIKNIQNTQRFWSKWPVLAGLNQRWFGLVESGVDA